MADDLNYGYKGAYVPQSFGNNTGVFDPADINNLIKDDKWTQYGQLELIETQTYSGATANIDFTSIDESTYNVHFMSFNNMQNSGGTSADLSVRFYESGVLETASVYQKAFQYGGTNGTFAADSSTSVSSILSIAGNYQNKEANGYVYFYNLGDSTKFSFVTFHNFILNSTSTGTMNFGSGVLPQASTVDGIQIIMRATGGTIDEGDFSLYGIKEYS